MPKSPPPDGEQGLVSGAERSSIHSVGIRPYRCQPKSFLTGTVCSSSSFQILYFSEIK